MSYMLRRIKILSGDEIVLTVYTKASRKLDWAID